MQTSLAFPKPGPALKGLLILVAVLGIGLALVGHTGVGRFVLMTLTCIPEQVMHFQVWRLVTSGLLTSPESYGHLIFSLLGLYFLSTDLEQRWGGKRFLAFMAGSVAIGNVLAILVDLVAPAAWRGFHPAMMYGPEAAIAATAVAWSSVNADKQILLFFVVPVRGMYLTWVTIGFCVLGVIYPGAPPAGQIAPFGGVLAGLLFGGSPSPAKRMLLRLRLWMLRRRLGDAAPPSVESIVRSATQKKRSGPPLRVVSGGLDEKKPPKDKRYLN